MISAAAIVIGLMLLSFGGDALVRGAVGLSQAFKLSPFLIGAVIVGFGTSAPELATSLSAAAQGLSGVAVGNVVGSNIANVLLIGGAAALVRPLAAPRTALARDGLALGAVTFVGMTVLARPQIGTTEGAALLVMLALYIGLTAWLDRRGGPAATVHAQGVAVVAASPEAVRASGSGASGPLGAGMAALWAVGGLAAVVVGARVLVFGAVDVAAALGVSEAVIGLTVVAVGTSLPELAAGVAAARRGKGDLALGNIIGSSIFNTLGILGATALIYPLTPPAAVVRVDMWVMAGSAVLLMAALVTNRPRVSRWEGAGLLAVYALYVVSLAAGVGR